MKTTFSPLPVLFMFIAVSRTAINNSCGCYVDWINLSANCSRLGIENLTVALDCIPNKTHFIYMGNNLISEIQDDAFKAFTSLRYLNLDYNIIEYLYDHAFVGLKTLNELSIIGNRLHHVDSFSKSLFLPLKNLRKLSIQGNCDVDQMNCSYPEDALSHLTSLEDLSVDGIPYTNLGNGFASLISLKSLAFTSNNGGRCHTPVLTPSTFAALEKTPVSFISMDGCGINTVLPYCFQKLWNLSKLIIIDNRYLCADAIENATLGLNETNISYIEFTYWCRDPVHSLKLEDGMLKGLTNTSLAYLDLKYNDITYVSPDCVDNMPISLEYISLKENRINDAKFLLNIWKLDNLRTFDLSYQYHNDANNDKNENIERMYIRSNEGIIYENTTIDSLIQLPKHIRTIYMNDIKLKYPIPPLSFSANELRYLNASGCLLLAFLGPWFGLQSLQVLDLSDNLIDFINPLSFSDMPNLRSLYLQNNQIGSYIGHDVKCLTFSKQRNLETLDISENTVKDLPYMIFQNQVKLRWLSIAKNALQNFSVFISSMSELRHLDLSGNEIVDISKENRLYLDKLASSDSIGLDLTGNILVCQCGNMDFMIWLEQTQVSITRKEQLTCLFTNNTLVSLEQLQEINSQLKYHCSSWIVLTSCISGFVGLTLIFSLVALVYHKRWQLRYLYYMGRRNLTPYHPIEDEVIELDTDAYISYDPHYDVTDDVDLHKFIADSIHPGLIARGFRVALREDLCAGQHLFNVITEAVRKSRKVVVFLTPTYCRDYWNTFEFNMAVYEGIYTKRNVIFPVIIGNLADMCLSPEIQSHVKSKVKSKEYIAVAYAESLVNGKDSFMESLTRNLIHV